jgi:thioredoxin-related protein
MMLPVVEKLIESGVPVDKIDIENPDNTDLVAKYGIKSIPAMVLVDENGEVLEKLVGMNPESRYVELFEKYKG